MASQLPSPYIGVGLQDGDFFAHHLEIISRGIGHSLHLSHLVIE
jgi:hypothetical protein